MVQDEAVRVFDHTDAQPELHRYSGLALADPFGAWFKDRENLLRMRNDLARQHPAADLVDLPFGVLQVVIERGQSQRDDPERYPLRAGRTHPLQQGLGLFQIVAVGLLNRAIVKSGVWLA